MLITSDPLTWSWTFRDIYEWPLSILIKTFGKCTFSRTHRKNVNLFFEDEQNSWNEQMRQFEQKCWKMWMPFTLNLSFLQKLLFLLFVSMFHPSLWCFVCLLSCEFLLSGFLILSPSILLNLSSLSLCLIAHVTVVVSSFLSDFSHHFYSFFFGNIHERGNI